MHPYRHLVIVLSLVAVVGIGFALALSVCEGDQLQHEVEWVKALLQAGLIAVLGAVTSGVLEAIKDAIQQRRDESRLRFDALTELERIYMDVKLVRRAAQASGNLDANQTQELNERQVTLELLKSNSNQFPQSADLDAQLSIMEKYLNRVATKPGSKEREGFLVAGFSQFAEAYKQASSLMRAEISTRHVVPKIGK